MTTRPQATQSARPFRSSRVALLGVLVLAICTVPLAFAHPALLVLLLLPLGAAAYVLRTGTQADAYGITVRTLLASRTVPWAEVLTVAVERGHVTVTTRAGEQVRLPGVGRSDVPRLGAASDGRLRPGPPA